MFANYCNLFSLVHKIIFSTISMCKWVARKCQTNLMLYSCFGSVIKYNIMLKLLLFNSISLTLNFADYIANKLLKNSFDLFTKIGSWSCIGITQSYYPSAKQSAQLIQQCSSGPVWTSIASHNTQLPTLSISSRTKSLTRLTDLDGEGGWQRPRP